MFVKLVVDLLSVKEVFQRGATSYRFYKCYNDEKINFIIIRYKF